MPALRLIFLLSALCLGSPAWAQAPAEPTKSEEPAEPVVEEPKIQAIPLSEIEARAVELAKQIQGHAAILAPNPAVEGIGEELPELVESVEAQLAATDQALKLGAPVEALIDLDERWAGVSEELDAWSRTLSSRTEAIEKLLGPLNDKAEAWQLTRAAARKATAPAAVLQRINKTLGEIAAARKQIEARRSVVLTLQSRVGDQNSRVNQARGRIEAAELEARRNLFQRDDPALWSQPYRKQLQAELDRGILSALDNDVEQLRAWVTRRADRIVVHGLLVIAVVVVLVRARSWAHQQVESEPVLARGIAAFDHPIASGLLIGAFFTLFLYPYPPLAVRPIIAAWAAGAGAILLRVFLPRAVLPAVYMTLLLFFIYRVLDVFRELVAFSRIVFLIEMGIALLILAILLRPARLASVPAEVAASRGFRAVGPIMRAGVVGFVVALLAAIGGFGQLARLIGFGLLYSAATALAFFALVVLLDNLVLFAVRAGPMLRLGMVRNHRVAIERGASRFFAVIAGLMWAYLTLDVISLWEPLFGLAKSILTASLDVGDLSISLGDFVAFGVVVYVSFLLSRAIRFVLDEDVYPRLQLKRGISYAVSTLAHYVLITLGFLLAVAATGLNLDRFAILVGALGVGIGFGLQNVVNNFVSGLILLFERPVQIGDVVEVGTLQGIVRRIGIRASVVRTWDGAEVVVPNGNLISEPLVNRTLSDHERRIELPVGVAYGTDPERVLSLLLEVARAHPDVIAFPEPAALFQGFGDSSLDFLLRAWTDRWEEGLRIKSELAVAVNRALREAGIEIPFPQRDLHLRSTPGSD